MLTVFRNRELVGDFRSLEEARGKVQSDMRHTLDCAKVGWITSFKPEAYRWEIEENRRIKEVYTFENMVA